MISQQDIERNRKLFVSQRLRIPSTLRDTVARLITLMSNGSFTTLVDTAIISKQDQQENKEEMIDPHEDAAFKYKGKQRLSIIVDRTHSAWKQIAFYDRKGRTLFVITGFMTNVKVTERGDTPVEDKQ